MPVRKCCTSEVLLVFTLQLCSRWGLLLSRKEHFLAPEKIKNAMKNLRTDIGICSGLKMFGLKVSCCKALIKYQTSDFNGIISEMNLTRHHCFQNPTKLNIFWLQNKNSILGTEPKLLDFVRMKPRLLAAEMGQRLVIDSHKAWQIEQSSAASGLEFLRCFI